jgi:uncharacterized Fe-S cluster-containing radical SAM superfamily protein
VCASKFITEKARILITNIILKVTLHQHSQNMSSQASELLETVGALLKDGEKVVELFESELVKQTTLKSQKEEVDRETERLIALEEKLEMKRLELLEKESKLFQDKVEHDLQVAAHAARIAAQNNSHGVEPERIEPELLHLHVSKLVCFYADLKL